MNIDEQPFTSHQMLTVGQPDQETLDNQTITESNSVETLNWKWRSHS